MPPKPFARLLATTASVLALIAAAVWLEIRLVHEAGEPGAGWRRTVAGLCAWLFIPALLLGGVLLLWARQRRSR